MAIIDHIVKFLDDHQYIFLTISVLLVMIGTPFFIESPAASFWMHFFLSFVLLSGLYAASSHGKFVFVSLFLGTFTLVFSWIDYAFFADKGVALTYMITGLIFFLFVTYNLLISIHKDKKVDFELIFGSIAGYLMLGITGAFVYAIIELVIPGSFSIDMNSFEQLAQFIYYSFVNLTTLGYGDIVPLKHHGQAWSVLFAIIGQMYLMILVGVVVGKYIKRSIHNVTHDDHHHHRHGHHHHHKK